MGKKKNPHAQPLAVKVSAGATMIIQSKIASQNHKGCCGSAREKECLCQKVTPLKRLSTGESIIRKEREGKGTSRARRP